MDNTIENRTSSNHPNWGRIVFVGGLVAAWAYTGFMNPSNLMNGLTTGEDCIKFAKERDATPAGDVIEARDLRIRNGKWVVDVTGSSPPSKELHSRVCVRSSDTIMIPSIFEEPLWR
jgi:hypothetical protein